MGLFDELKKLTHTYEDEDDEYEEDFPDVRKPDNTAALFDDRRRERSEERRSNKVVNIHATTQLKVVLVSPQHFEDASEIADQLKNKRTVVMNLEATNKDGPAAYWSRKNQPYIHYFSIPAPWKCKNVESSEVLASYNSQNRRQIQQKGEIYHE